MNNIDELIRLVEAYNMTYTYVLQPLFARFRVCHAVCSLFLQPVYELHNRCDPRTPFTVPSPPPTSSSGCRYVFKSPGSFAEQLALFSSHGIVLQMHGAGETNIM
jgi:hypothetical protein